MHKGYQLTVAIEHSFLRILKRAILLMKGVFILSAVWFISVFLFFSISHLFYEYYLYWYEDSGLEVLERIRSGIPIYVAPSERYVPFIYPPLYYYIATLLSLITGISLLPLRLLSFLSSIGTLIIIYRFIQKETRSTSFAFIGVGIYASTYTLTEGVMGLGRLDALHCFLLLLMLYQIRYATSLRHHLVAGVLAGLAYFTKQTTLILVFLMGIYYFQSTRKYLWAFIIPLILLGAAGIWYFTMVTDGWYIYYTQYLPTRHSLGYISMTYFITRDIFYFIGALALLGGLVALRKRNFFFLFSLMGMVGISFIGRANTGGSPNVLMPAYTMITICAGVALQDLFTHAARSKRVYHLFIATFIIVISIVQMYYGYINYYEGIPNERDKKNAQRLILALKNIDGDVYIPSHNYFLREAGKKPQAHMHWLHELTGHWGKGIPTKEGKILEKKLIDNIVSKKFGAIVLDNTQVEKNAMKSYANPYQKFIEKNYSPVKQFPIKMRFADIVFTLYKPK